MRSSETENLFSKLFDLAPSPYQMLDEHGCFLRVNQAWQDILGYRAEEVLEKNFGEFLAPFSQMKFRETFPLFKEEGTLSEEFVFIHKSGREKTMTLKGSFESHGDGTQKQAHCFLKEKHENQHSFEKDEDHNRKIQFLSHSASEMLELEKLSSIYTYICENVQKQYPGTIVLIVSVEEENGLTRLMDIAGFDNRFLQKTIRLAGFNPLGKEYKLLPDHQKIWKSGNLHEYKGGLADFASTEFPGSVAKGLQKLFDIHKIYTIGINKGDRLLSAVHVITRHQEEIADNKFIETFVKQAGIVIQRKMLEKELFFHSMVLNQIKDMVTVTNMHGDITYINREIEKMINRPSSEILGRSVDIYQEGQKSGPSPWRVMKETMKSGYWRGEISRTDSKGNDFFYDLRAQLLRDCSNSPIGISRIATDITERKMAWQRMTRSEANARAVLEATSEVIILVDKDFCIIDTNEVHASRFGLTREAIIGKSLDDFLPPEHAKRRKAWIRKVFEKRKTLCFEDYRAGHWYDSSISPVYNEDGTVDRVAVFSKDITSRKMAEEKIRESERKYRSIMKNISDVVFVADVNLKINYISPSCERFFDEPADALLKSGIEKKLPPGDVEKVYRFFKEELDMKGDSGRYPDRTRVIETRHVQKNGKILLLSLHLSMIRDEEGKPDGLLGIIRDVTRQKREEQIKELIYETAKTSAISTSLEELLGFIRTELGQIMDTTNFYVAMYRSETDTFHKTIFLNEADDFTEWKASGSLAGKILQNGQTLLFNNEGEIRTASVNRIVIGGIPAKCWLGVPLKENQKTIGVMVVKSNTDPNAYTPEDARLMEMIAHEISSFIERRNMIKNLIKAKKEAEKSDKLKSAFLANMSHEIRTPMNGILGFIDLLGEPDLEEKIKKEYIDILNKSSQRLLNTINDIIEISKIDVGEWELVFSEVNIREVLNYFICFFRPEAEGKGISLKIKEQETGEEAFIRTDRTKLEGILTNLIKNALKFTKKGSIELGSYLEQDQVVFYVQDTGKGIPADKHDLIFNRFTQADSKLTRGHEGSGLGLSIVKANVEIIGGEIWLESEVDKGSTFYFSIPYYPRQKQWGTGNRQKNADVVPVETGSALENRKTILIAEDDPESSLFLKTVLTRENYDVIEASSGEGTLQVLFENPDIDMILMDLKMPGIGGLEATRRIREFNSGIPVIAQTAYAMEGDRGKALEAGCNDYLSKPVSRNDLIRMVRKYLE